MGKKRRLNSAKLKFNAKHRNHPRAKLLAKRAQESVESEAVEETVTLETSPEVVLEPKVVETPTKAKKTTAPRKKKATTPRKRATKKKTNSASA